MATMFEISEERDIYDVQIRMRVERLQKLLTLHAPKAVVAAEVLLVMKAAVGYCGDAFGTAWQNMWLSAVRQGLGRCVSCGKDGVKDAYGLCPECAGDPYADGARDFAPK